MSGRVFEVKIDRVIVVGKELDDKRSKRLRALIEQAMSEKMTTFRTATERFEGEAIRIHLPGLSLDSVEGERRVAYATAEAVMDALLGKTT